MSNSKVGDHILLKNYGKNGLNASKAAHEICSVKGEAIIDGSTAKKKK